MTHALIGRKVQMTQIFADDGRVIPVTMIHAGPCPVTQIRTPDNDGYSAFQIGFEEQKKNVKKPMKGHFRKAKVTPQRHLREVRLGNGADCPVQVGQELTVAIFAAGDKVDVIGTTKGKGFQGTVKRHRFGRGPEGHGSMNVRKPGSIAAQRTGPTAAGVRMAGHMGHVRSTARNLEIVRIDPASNIIFVKGSVPGPNGGIVVVRDAKTTASKEQRERAFPAAAAKTE